MSTRTPSCPLIREKDFTPAQGKQRALLVLDILSGLARNQLPPGLDIYLSKCRAEAKPAYLLCPHRLGFPTLMPLFLYP